MLIACSVPTQGDSRIGPTMTVVVVGRSVGEIGAGCGLGWG